jgi:uncharacterized OsmC-like protein
MSIPEHARIDRLNDFLTVRDLTTMLNQDTAGVESLMTMKLKSKYPEYLEYHAQSKWDGKTGGIAAVTDDRQIVYDTPKTYGGRGEGVCPDEMFVSSVLGCLNNTFLDFQRRFELELISLELEGKAAVRFDGEGYKIESVSVSADVVVGEDELETGQRCVELMREYCHLTRTIKTCIPIVYSTSVREQKSSP